MIWLKILSNSLKLHPNPCHLIKPKVNQFTRIGVLLPEPFFLCDKKMPSKVLSITLKKKRLKRINWISRDLRLSSKRASRPSDGENYKIHYKAQPCTRLPPTRLHFRVHPDARYLRLILNQLCKKSTAETNFSPRVVKNFRNVHSLRKNHLFRFVHAKH